MSARRLVILAGAVALSFGAATAPAHDPAAHPGHVAQAAAPKPGGARVTLADVPLVDQDGTPRKLKSEVIGERIAIVDFIYTTCTTACPVLSAIMAQVQRRLGDSVGREVALVSMSVDPARDTPTALKAYGAKHGARDGWLFLTGPVQTVNGALKGFGAYVADPASHPPMVLVGDARTGEWSRHFGFPSAEELVARVNELRRARMASGEPRDPA